MIGFVLNKLTEDRDKREAVFLEDMLLKGAGVNTPSLRSHVVRSSRIPDCPFGLSVSKKTADVTSGPTSAKSLLNYEDLRHLLLDPHSGLISDPKWLSLDLAFPWAVYEAKKTKTDSVVEQIRRSSEIYLNMLHDLCLEPGLPESARHYQNFEDTQFQVFAMTSEGPFWTLYVCYRRQRPELPLWLEDPADIPHYVSIAFWRL